MNADTGRIRPDGTRLLVAQTPSIGEAWSQGMPNWFFFSEMDSHPSGQRVAAVPGLVAPNGVAWIELGGTESEMSNWLGIPASNLPFRFNGGIPGIHAVAVKTGNGEVVIRRNVAVAAT